MSKLIILALMMISVVGGYSIQQVQESSKSACLRNMQLMRAMDALPSNATCVR